MTLAYFSLSFREKHHGFPVQSQTQGTEVFVEGCFFLKRSNPDNHEKEKKLEYH